jgi:hypothetical protein
MFPCEIRSEQDYQRTGQLGFGQTESEISEEGVSDAQEIADVRFNGWEMEVVGYREVMMERVQQMSSGDFPGWEGEGIYVSQTSSITFFWAAGPDLRGGI